MEGAGLGPRPARSLPLLRGPAGILAHEDLNKHPSVANHHHRCHHHRHDHFECHTFGNGGGAAEGLAFILTDHNEKTAQQFWAKQQQPCERGHSDQGHPVVARQDNGSPAMQGRNFFELRSSLELDDQPRE